MRGRVWLPPNFKFLALSLTLLVFTGTEVWAAAAPAPAVKPTTAKETPAAPDTTKVETDGPAAGALPGPEDIPIEALSAEETPGTERKRDLGILEGIIEDYDYRGQDKRDPFAPFMAVQQTEATAPIGPVTQLERFDLDQLRLVGIIWNVPKPKALVLDPENKTYVVFNKTRIGRNNGYVAEIREGELVVIEAFSNEGRQSYQPRIIKLQRE